jgi:hypothetical protein
MYDDAIDYLANLKGTNLLTTHVYKQRNLFSIGWTGDTPNNYHAKDGIWSKHGISTIKSYLKCLKVPLPLIINPIEERPCSSANVRSIIGRVSIQPGPFYANSMKSNRGRNYGIQSKVIAKKGFNYRGGKFDPNRGRQFGRSRSRSRSPIRVDPTPSSSRHSSSRHSGGR